MFVSLVLGPIDCGAHYETDILTKEHMAEAMHHEVDRKKETERS